MEKDYYKILGISKTADEGEIKKAYRKMAMEHHPDRNQGDSEAETKFKEVSEAYNTLSDPGKRQTYDTYGHNRPEPRRAGGFSDVFREFGFGPFARDSRF